MKLKIKKPEKAKLVGVKILKRKLIKFKPKGKEKTIISGLKLKPSVKLPFKIK